MSDIKTPLTASLYSPTPPTKEQEERFLRFLKKHYGQEIPLVWNKREDIQSGFRLVVDADVYDWTAGGLAEQLKEAFTQIASQEGNIIPLLKETVQSWTPQVLARQCGTVLTVGDGIATVTGLTEAEYGEVLLFENGIRGMVQNLTPNEAGCILFDGEDLCAGSTVQRTGKTAGIPVGEDFLGRVVDALGRPIDAKGDIKASGYRPIERPAPGIIDRQPVNKPLETGILTIDAMFPIGRGQRELIIGDRQTGKTAIALDTILNQKGKDVICIYVSIGQKASSIAQLVNILQEHNALPYTVVVHASASDSAPLQYIAPYAGCAIGEYFMEHGKDVLIVYDDLSKHAVAYRSLSLLLDRAPGREAYPGDVFYLHSRLLERAAHLSQENGGGSMTALPIVETKAGDVSAYIPTNTISITDGQLFLESNLFFSGQRPAVNVGLSVSRVGSDAQTKAMKSASAGLRLELAQYREMKVFTQFASDLDKTVKDQLLFGGGLTMLLRQPQYAPYPQHQQVILLVTAMAHLLKDIALDDFEAFIPALLSHYETLHKELCTHLIHSKRLTSEERTKITEISKAFIEGWKR